MNRDALTPVQRLAAWGRGEPIDRLPCVPIVGNGAARVLGVKVRALRADARLLAAAQTAAWRRFGYDNVRIFTDLYVLAEAMGATVTLPEDETAYLAAPAIDDVAGIAALQPADPRRDGLLPRHLEALERTLAAIGDQVPVSAAVTGPLTTASFLIGAEKLSRLMLKDPEAVHRLCRIALDSAIGFAAAIIAAGGTPSLTEPMASSTVISPRQFATFAQPYLTELVDFIHRQGKPVTLHICGKTEKSWEGMVATGADTLSLDNEVDLAAAAAKIGDRVRIMGHVHPTAVLLSGTPATVRQAVRDGVRQAHAAPRGYIVASGCSLPTETPFANIDAMLAAVREIGWPVQPHALTEGS
ncbi:methylcobamide--CoM methyltransferase [Desulfuromonas carbonis]|uniref:uroporphyrinogen decarboxylase family protein n=1 Tax=Desulfuromonas sp. DDH964 TaxID=1823759 RepID=UPI00078E02C1|nr:uroporphyrinogen decarboxylase family protein [Desulfuromonas sp. DDH964]AMV70572.1 uroporphyrinogen decarboxylase [Desulfuromonas sp. DDH964]